MGRTCCWMAMHCHSTASSSRQCQDIVNKGAGRDTLLNKTIHAATHDLQTGLTCCFTALRGDSASGASLSSAAKAPWEGAPPPSPSQAPMYASCAPAPRGVPPSPGLNSGLGLLASAHRPPPPLQIAPSAGLWAGYGLLAPSQRRRTLLSTAPSAVHALMAGSAVPPAGGASARQCALSGALSSVQAAAVRSAESALGAEPGGVPPAELPSEPKVPPVSTPEPGGLRHAACPHPELPCGTPGPPTSTPKPGGLRHAAWPQPGLPSEAEGPPVGAPETAWRVSRPAL